MFEKMLSALNKRSFDVFMHIVDAYVERGDPIGSKALSSGMNLSSATIRNVMAELESHGLLYSPHVSAGRLPTELGLRLFVNGLLEVGGELPVKERQAIENSCQGQGKSFEQLLDSVTTTISGLSSCAGLVMSPKTESTLKHIEFVSLNQNRVLVILVTEDGMVENRIINLPQGLPPSSLIEATNFLNSHLAGKTLSEVKAKLLGEMEKHQFDLDELSSKVVQEGLAIWSGDEKQPQLIIRGQSNLLNDVKQLNEVEKLKSLFDAFDTRQELVNILDAAIDAEGVQIFIGSENELFHHTGCSVIVSPYSNEDGRVVGAIGVIGPKHINYSRIIPMVDFTAKLIGRTLS